MDHVIELSGLAAETAQELARERAGVVVAALTRDETEFAGAAGATPSTVFEIGSVTKVFTSLVLAGLAEKGAVSLDEPLADVLGAQVPSRGGTQITLRHLAMHTSGL